jgi:hypothetical protein
MLQCFLFAIYLILQKPLLARLPTTTITFYTFLFGILPTTTIAAYFCTTMDWTVLPPMWFVSMVYTVLVASIAGFLLFSYATKHLPASASSMGVTLQPFFSSILGATILGEVLTYMHIVGGVFLIGGLSIVLWSRARETAAVNFQKDLERIRLAQEVELTAASPVEWLSPGSRKGSIDGYHVDVLSDGSVPTDAEVAASASTTAAAATPPPSSRPRLSAATIQLPDELDHNPAHIMVDDSVATGSKARRASQRHGVATQIRKQIRPSTVRPPPSTKQHPRLGPEEEDPFQ